MLFQNRFAWVSMAPLGCPVVPEVYMITAMSSGSANTGAVSGARPASSSSSTSQPGAGCQRNHPAQPGLRTHRIDHRGALSVGHQGVRLRVAQDVAELVGGQSPVQRHERGADPCGGEQRDQKVRVVQARVADPIPALHAPGGQFGRQPVDAIREISVGPRAFAVGDGKQVRRRCGPTRDPGAEIDRGNVHLTNASPRALGAGAVRRTDTAGTVDALYRSR